MPGCDDFTRAPQSAMFVFAHPDDAEFLCGGTVAKWSRAGTTIVFLICTDGGVGTDDRHMPREALTSLRREEQRRACDILGVSSVEFLNFRDCELQASIDLRYQIVRAIRQQKPQVVVCDDPDVIIFDDDFLPGQESVNHPDHRAASIAVLDAVFPCANMPLLWPELGSPHKVSTLFVRTNRKANVCIDISDTIEVKISAIQQHASQIVGWNPRPTILKWGIWEGMLKGVDFAETYRRVSL